MTEQHDGPCRQMKHTAAIPWAVEARAFGLGWVLCSTHATKEEAENARLALVSNDAGWTPGTTGREEMARVRCVYPICRVSFSRTERVENLKIGDRFNRWTDGKWTTVTVRKAFYADGETDAQYQSPATTDPHESRCLHLETESGDTIGIVYRKSHRVWLP